MLRRLLSAARRQIRSRLARSRRESLCRNYRPVVDQLESRRLLAAGDFTFYRRGPVTASPVASYANPQITTLGDTFLATGANYASYSKDDGITWKPVNPATIFGNDPTAQWDDAGFSGDTRLVTDTHRGMTLWLENYSPYIPVDSNGDPDFDSSENGMRLAVSYSDKGIETSTWSVIDISMYSLGQVKGVFLVNPQMQVSANFVYMEADIIHLVDDGDNGLIREFQGSAWWRFSLDEIKSGGNITRGVTYFTDQGPIGLVNGADTVMYGAMNVPSYVTGSAHTRIYTWPDFDLNPSFDPTKKYTLNTVADTGVTSYTGTRTIGDDDVDVIFPNKVQTGWLRTNGELGFMWDSAAQSGTHPNAFLRSLVVDTNNNLFKLGTPDLYSNTETYFYPSAAVNARGDVALIVGRYTGTGPVSNDILIDDSDTPAGLPSNGQWERYTAANGGVPTGTTPTDFVTAGRYYGITANSSFPNTWLAGGYVDNGTSQPRYYWFGRVRDTPPPNLKGASLDVTQDTARAGDTVTAKFQVSNEGITDAGAFQVAFYASADATIDPATDTLIGSTAIPSLSAGVTTGVLSRNFTMPDAANPFWALVGSKGYYIGMFTDSNNDITESVETDNRNLGLAIDVTQMFPADFGDNNTVSTASDLGYLSGIRTYDRLAISPAGDQDWYKLRAPYNGTLTTKIDFQNASGNLTLNIRDASGTIIGSSATTNNGEMVTVNVTTGNAYYIQVLGVGAAQNAYVMTTDYRIVPVDPFEANDSFQFATGFGTTPIVSQPGLSIDKYTDEDFFKFTAPGSGLFTASITLNNQYGNLDLYMVDQFGAQVAQSVTNNNTEAVSYQVVAGQLYYLHVDGRGADTNKYKLDYESPAPPVYRNGNTVFVTGTVQDDTFTFIPESPSAGSNRIIVNGVSYTVVASSLKYRFDGKGGNNTLIVNGTSRADTISNTFTTVKMNNYTMDMFAINNLTQQGQAGDDSVTSTGTRKVTIYGGDGDDNLFGGDNNDTIYGGKGVDHIFGGNGNDSLYGEEGFDTLTDGEGDDKLYGGPGNDIFRFVQPFSGQLDLVDEIANAGTDTLDFSSGTSVVTVDLNRDYSLAAQGLRAIHVAAGGEAKNFENIIGSPGDDLLIGNAAVNLITGGEGSDRMEGRAGDDTYIFANPLAAQTDTIREVNETGVDTFDFSSSNVPVTADLLLDIKTAVHGSRQVKMTGGGLSANVENLIGSQGDDFLYGNSSNNIIEGGEGNDFMQGRLGDDRYVFRDALQVQTDTIAEYNGGGTKDMIDFSGITNTLTGVNVDLRTSGQTIATHAARTVNVSSAGQAAAIESIVGGSGDDILIGNNAANYIRGNDGRDILVGGSGVDFLTGSAGDDIVIGGNTSHSLANLQKIQLEWLSANAYDVRLDHIRGPNSGLNGQNFLAFDTVFEDSVADTLKGDAGKDWFWLGINDTDDLGGTEQSN